MNYIFILLLMIFAHIIDDFCLQGWLASAKQRDYWIKNAPAKMYRYDYICALIIHGFSWTFMMMLPIAFVLNFEIDLSFLAIFFINLVIHAVTDDIKANLKKINLITDQSIHVLQILITWTMIN